MVPDRVVRALDRFEALLTGVPAGRWESPSPCPDWSAIDVAGHVVAGSLVIRPYAEGWPLPEADPDWPKTARTDPGR